MTAADFLPQLSKVKPRPHGWLAQCPAHDDRSPSLSISEGQHALLLKCFAGCTLEEITRSLGLRVSELFYDTGLSDSAERRNAMRQRAQQRAARHAAYEAEGRRLDLHREAEGLIDSASGIDISTWTDEQLDTVLGTLADAYAIAYPTGDTEHER